VLNPSGKVIDTSSDIWSLGCIAYILKFNRQPFQGDQEDIVNCKVHYPVEDDLTSLIKMMLCVDQALRPSAESLEKIFSTMLS
jgi:serine/threonine protein kinase